MTWWMGCHDLTSPGIWQLMTWWMGVPWPHQPWYMTADDLVNRGAMTSPALVYDSWWPGEWGAMTSPALVLSYSDPEIFWLQHHSKQCTTLPIDRGPDVGKNLKIGSGKANYPTWWTDGLWWFHVFYFMTALPVYRSILSTRSLVNHLTV